MSYLYDVTRAQQRMAQLVNEAEADRLLPDQPGVTDHVLATVGTWMISTGKRLTRLSALGANDKKLSVIETANG